MVLVESVQLLWWADSLKTRFHEKIEAVCKLFPPLFIGQLQNAPFAESYTPFDQNNDTASTRIMLGFTEELEKEKLSK